MAEKWAKECHSWNESWNVTIRSPECDFGRKSESITQSKAKLYEQHIHLSGVLTFVLNILQRTGINIEEKNTWFLTSSFRFVHLSFLLISAFLCSVISSRSNDFVLAALLLVEEPAQAVTQNYHKLELAPRPARECSDVVISSQYPEQIKENSEMGWSVHLPKKTVSWQSALLSTICVVLQINNLCRLGILGIEILEFWNFALSFLHGKNFSIYLWLSETRKIKSNIFPVLKQFQTSWASKIFCFLFH